METLKYMEPYWVLLITVAFLAIVDDSTKKKIATNYTEYSGTMGYCECNSKGLL